MMLVTGGTHAGEFLRLLGNGREYGINRLAYGYQEKAGGIAEALGLAEEFADGDPVLVMLADNVMERSIQPMVDAFRADPTGARILLTAGGRARAPAPPRRARASVTTAGWCASRRSPRCRPAFWVTGIYCYDADVFDIIRNLVPSGRGELEITDVNNHYVDAGQMAYDVLEGFWGDAGESIEAYYAVNDFVRANGANRA